MWIVGLGNPGPRYAATRHNVGMDVVLRLVERWKARPYRRGSEFESYRLRHGDQEITLIAPLTFMNRSGQALAAYERVGGERPEPSHTLVVCDDVYLPVGTMRLRAQGSSGGHNGLASIEEYFATRSYPRLRIGVGHSVSEGLSDHVLSDFGEDEESVLQETIEQAELAVEVWSREGIEAAMNRFNRRPKEDHS